MPASEPIQYWIDPASHEAGVRVEFAVIRGITISQKDPELERWKRPIQRQLREIDLDKDPVLIAYRELNASVGNATSLASPEYLLRLIQRAGKLPQINTAVDAYNIISAETRAVLSAHDLDKLQGPVGMVVLRQPATFDPLGSTESETLPAGEFTIRDDQHALCRLNSKQSRLSSTSLSTKSLLIDAQGNKLLEGEKLKAAIDAACESIIRFTGGNREPMIQVEMPQN